MAKSGRLDLGTIFTDIIGLYSTTVTYLASEAIEFGEKRKIRAITLFKVIQGHQGWHQSKARMRLLISDL